MRLALALSFVLLAACDTTVQPDRPIDEGGAGFRAFFLADTLGVEIASAMAPLFHPMPGDSVTTLFRLTVRADPETDFEGTLTAVCAADPDVLRYRLAVDDGPTWRLATTCVGHPREGTWERVEGDAVVARGTFTEAVAVP